jgi:predicted AAA+ superfamily ATPase
MKRTKALEQVETLFRTHPVVAILGPRQCGKTTLARDFAKRHLSSEKIRTNFLDLENPTDEARLMEPMLTFEQLEDLVIIDEVQRSPDLFKVLRVLVDQRPRKHRFLILGSASRELIKQSSESLAGRIHYMELTPFQLQEVGHESLKRLWIRGGFPPSFLASNEEESARWRRAYIRTFLEQDIPALGIKIAPNALRRFWTMLAHYHGQIFNASEIARSLGVADTTVRHYLDILCGTFMIRELKPWHENLGKREVKRPKIFFRDSGLFHSLTGIDHEADLLVNPKIGASWEGFAMEECIRHLDAEAEDLYFWAVHSGAELDLLHVRGTKRNGYEFKYTDKPRMTTSIRVAIDSLKLSQLTIIYPGEQRFQLDKNVEAVPLRAL